jgi:hypothetical protein
MQKHTPEEPRRRTAGQHAEPHPNNKQEPERTVDTVEERTVDTVEEHTPDEIERMRAAVEHYDLMHSFPRMLYNHALRTYVVVDDQAQLEERIAAGWSIEPYAAPTDEPVLELQRLPDRSYAAPAAAYTLEERDTIDANVLRQNEINENLIGSGTKYRRVEISSADVTSGAAGKLGHMYGQVLVPAPGPGKCLMFVQAALINTAKGQGYTGGGDVAIHSGSGGAAITGSVAAGNTFGSVQDRACMFVPFADSAHGLSENKSLNLKTALPFTQPVVEDPAEIPAPPPAGAAQGTAVVHIVYRLITL